MIKEKLQKYIAEILNIPQSQIHLEHPENFSHGDFSCNIALIKAKELGENPKKLAESFVAKLSAKKLSDISKIEVAGPGFINLHLSKEFFENSIKEIENNENFGENNFLKGKKYFIEHTQPNPFKEFHIGHLMNNAIGESLARIIKESGADIKTASYHGDKGLHVAKAVWAMKKGIEYEHAYAYGNKAYEEDAEAKQEINSINKVIYEQHGPGMIEIIRIFNDGIEKFKNYFEVICKRLGTTFTEKAFWEHFSGERGKKIVEENIGRVFEESEGAVIFKGEKHGLHTRVFLTSDKLPTYEAKELGLAWAKNHIYTFDKSITITGSEQNDFFKVTEVAMGEVFPELKGKFTHLSHGLIRLSGGKMSSRAGNVVTAEELIDKVKQMALEKMDYRNVHNENQIAEQIAIGAIKFSILKQSPGKDIIFDFDKSISFEGDSGPYLQYTAVRANSVLEKGNKFSLLKLFGFKKDKKPTEITNIERLLYRLPEIIERACREYAPQYVVTYLLEVAGAYNAFYGSNQIIGSDYESYYLSLTKATRRVLENGLNILAIKVPEKM